MGVASWYKRWRHSRGFGVHSPYAYRIVTEVLNPGRRYAYYLEETLPSRRLRLLYRVIAELRPASIVISAPESERKVLESLCALIPPGPGNPLLIFWHVQPTDIPAGHSAYFEIKAIPVASTLPTANGYGRLFINPRRALYAAIPDLRAQTINVRF